MGDSLSDTVPFCWWLLAEPADTPVCSPDVLKQVFQLLSPALCRELLSLQLSSCCHCRHVFFDLLSLDNVVLAVVAAVDVDYSCCALQMLSVYLLWVLLVVKVVVVVLLQKLGPANTLHFVVRDVKKVSLCFFVCTFV